MNADRAKLIVDELESVIEWYGALYSPRGLFSRGLRRALEVEKPFSIPVPRCRSEWSDVARIKIRFHTRKPTLTALDFDGRELVEISRDLSNIVTEALSKLILNDVQILLLIDEFEMFLNERGEDVRTLNRAFAVGVACAILTGSPYQTGEWQSLQAVIFHRITPEGTIATVLGDRKMTAELNARFRKVVEF